MTAATPYIMASSNYTLSINAASKAKDASAAFLEWMAEDAQQQKYYELSGELPVSAYKTMDLTGTIYEPVVDLLAVGLVHLAAVQRLAQPVGLRRARRSASRVF